MSDPKRGKSSSWCYKPLNFCPIDMKLGIYISLIGQIMRFEGFSKCQNFQKSKKFEKCQKI